MLAAHSRAQALSRAAAARPRIAVRRGICSLTEPKKILAQARSSSIAVHSAVVVEQQTDQQQQQASTPEVARDASHAVEEEAWLPQEAAFQWRRHWWPVAPLDMLDKKRPTPFTLLGVDVVVWWSEKESRWQAFRDICPHRLAPLSQGRLSKDGSSLVCSYHGWKFNTAGACTQITQLDAASQAKVCGTERTCATAFPTLEEEGLLFAWMDPSPQGLELSKLKGVPKAPVNPNKPKGDKMFWVANLVPNDLKYWLEQSQDPSHANWLHAGPAFKSEDAVPMAHTRAPRVDLLQGFDYEHGGYEKRNAAMKATRHFIPPYTTIGLYRQPYGTQLLNTRFVPVRPGWVRTFASFDFLPPGADTTVLRDTRTGDAIPPPPSDAARSATADAAPAKAQQAPAFLRALNPLSWLLARVSSGDVPHWLFNANTLGDQDVVIQHEMEVLQARNKLDHTNYAMPAVGADVGVAAIHRWLRLAQYPQALYGEGAKGGHEDPLPLERLLDRRERHVQYCVQCQQGLALMTRVFWALAGAAFVSTSFGLGLLAAASVGAAPWQATGVPLAALLAGGVMLAKAAQAAWEFREERFISGVRSWRRAGGLSLVKMPDA